MWDGISPSARRTAGPLQQDVIPGSGREFLAMYADTIGAIATFLVAFVAVYLLGTRVLVPAVDRILDRRGFDRAVRSLGGSVMAVVVWALALAIALTLAGFGGFIAAFGVFAGAVALAVGFAAQDLLSNFAAGVFILKDKPFGAGDWIEWDGMAGRVEDVDLRVTRVRTFANELVVVPNADLANNAVTNPVAHDTLRQSFVFGIGYEDDIDEAISYVLEEAAAVDGILADPAPDVRVTDLGDSDVGLQARFWIGDPSRSDVVRARSEFVKAVKQRFDAEGIDMPYPYRQLTGDVEIDGRVATRQASSTDD